MAYEKESPLKSLFDQNIPDNLIPLSEKLRPQSIQEMVGQSHFLSKRSAIAGLLKNSQLVNLIFWGPPGTGKTTLAKNLAHQCEAFWIEMNAIDCGVKDLKAAGEKGREMKIEQHRKTLLFVDEIHRFNKSQQDVLLPYIEKGDLYLIGATTENPSYELNKALLSRCQVIEFRKLEEDALKKILEKAFLSFQLNPKDVLSEESQKRIIEHADGDSRKLLNILDVIIKTYQGSRLIKSEQESQSLTDSRSTDHLSQSVQSSDLDKNTDREFSSFEVSNIKGDSEKSLHDHLEKNDDPHLFPLNPTDLTDFIGKKILNYDKKSDQHYDTISAFIKSMRGSDPDAALYYCARMLEGGEDPIFIARRMIIFASEDIGNADPRALPLAIACLQALEAIGMPEGRINLGQTICFLASAPKSNRSYLAINRAIEYVKKTGSAPIPAHLRSQPKSRDYKYPHDYEKGFVSQNYWPETLKPEKFYEPKARGQEKIISEYLKWLREETE